MESKMFHIFKALHQGESLLYKPQRGCLCIYGPDARDFLQRMSTADFTKLSATNPIDTCFINNKGRLIEHCYAFLGQHEDIILVTSNKTNTALYDWLSNYHFVENLSFDTDFAPDISFVMQKSNSRQIQTGALYMGCAKTHEGIAVDYFCVLSDISAGLVIDDEAWQALRIMALLPEYPHEISEQYMPDVVNLEHCIAEDKGCYIGQEVIQKARTYQKHKKRLYGATFTEAEFEKIKIGSYVQSKQGQIGMTTSCAPFYLNGDICALVVSDKEAIIGKDLNPLEALAESFIAKN